MAKLQTMRSGGTQHPEQIMNFLASRLVSSSGVVDKSAGHFQVTEETTPAMSVSVAEGYAYLVNSSGDMAYPAWLHDGNASVTITANSSGNTRIDAIVLYIDLGESANAEITNVAKLVAVEGTPSASPTAPTDSDVQSVIGASNPYIRLANVTVTSGATAITNSDITDQRVEMETNGFIKDLIRLAEQSSTPNTPESNKAKIYVGDGTVDPDKALIYLPDTGVKHYLELSNELFRNAIINGNFDIWQRGTSFSISGGSQYTADRWKCATGTSGVETVSQQAFTPGQTDVPNNPRYFLRVDRTVAATSDNAVLSTRLENPYLYSGKTFTLTFWAKANAPKTLKLYIKAVMNGATVETTTTKDIALTTSWQMFTYTVTFSNFASGATITDNDYLHIRIDEQTTYSTFIVDFAQFNFNEGSVPQPYIPRPYALELALCQRFYEVIGVNVDGYAGGAVSYSHTIHFVEKRTTPSASVTGVSSTNIGYYGFEFNVGHSQGNKVGRWRITPTSTGSAFACHATVALDAEL